jgi:hypothetical protein
MKKSSPKTENSLQKNDLCRKKIAEKKIRESVCKG